MTELTPGIILAPVSAGELLDKIAILEIKTVRIDDAEKRQLARYELGLLELARAERLALTPRIAELCRELSEVNAALWAIEDRIRVKEREAAFDAEFIALARSIYHNNDRRADIKRSINMAVGSPLIEVKGYGPTAPAAVDLPAS